MSSSSTTVTIPDHYDIKLGGDGTTVVSDSEIALTSISTSKSDSTASLDLKVEPLDIKVEPLDIKIEPLDLKIEPLKIDTGSTIDVKPLAIDSCTTIKLAPLPPIHLEQPYSTHFGFTYMGMELFGFTLSGKSATYLSSPPKPQFHSVEMPEPHKHFDEPSRGPSQAQPRSALRVKIKD